MNFENMRLLFVFSCFVLGLVILSPSFFAVFPIPEGEGFSELWLLDSNYIIENGILEVFLNEQNTIKLGVNNQKLGLESYKVYVKLLNQLEAFQEIGTGLPVSLEPIFEYRFILSNNETWEETFEFIFQNVSFEGNTGKIFNLSIDGNDIIMDKILTKDTESDEFYCQMVFELWTYNSTVSVFQFNNNFVGLWMSMNRQL